MESLPLSLVGTNKVPADCSLLVIASPKSVVSDFELDKINTYLKEGGRLLALFDFGSANKSIGLEKLFAQWGVEVGDNCVKDPENSNSRASGLDATDVVVSDFSRKHVMMSPFVNADSRLQMYLPRTVQRVQSRVPPADAPTVEELAFTGPRAVVYVDGKQSGSPGKFPLIAAVEKGAIKDVKNEQSTTRMVIAGDALFLANTMIDFADNRAFADNAVNWLLERSESFMGSAQPVVTYKVLMTNSQMRDAQIVLLAAFPGVILLFGSLVWLRRRR